jgi:hypothetical protein
LALLWLGMLQEARLCFVVLYWQVFVQLCILVGQVHSLPYRYI